MEQHYKDNLCRQDAIKLTIKSLLEVVQTGYKNIEIVVMDRNGAVYLDQQQVENISIEIEKENAAEVFIFLIRLKKRLKRLLPVSNK